jgi:hypothetical protein
MKNIFSGFTSGLDFGFGMDKKIEVLKETFAEHKPFCTSQEKLLLAMVIHHESCHECQQMQLTFIVALMQKIPILYTLFDSPQHFNNLINERIANYAKL